MRRSRISTVSFKRLEAIPRANGMTGVIVSDEQTGRIAFGAAHHPETRLLRSSWAKTKPRSITTATTCRPLNLHSAGIGVRNPLKVGDGGVSTSQILSVLVPPRDVLRVARGRFRPRGAKRSASSVPRGLDDEDPTCATFDPAQKLHGEVC